MLSKSIRSRSTIVIVISAFLSLSLSCFSLVRWLQGVREGGGAWRREGVVVVAGGGAW
ncbi:hypothetical protein HanHA300_Chr17g0651021 [Helianthus annuus]|nr:hypothetical protein HanHA300_Chr17g0651021 [Helianthus annuus]KAJ0632132.1 hypothetical protein HanLR1_Chr17g0661631 [Helianthus annuus]